jgi:hypothetical protein
MSRLFLCLVICLGFVQLTQAQFLFGFKAGTNLNSVQVKPSGKFLSREPETRLGYHVGVLMNISISKEISFNPEFQFVQRGYKINPPYSVNEVCYSLNYIELPLIFSFSPGKIIGLEIGPNFGYMVSVNASSERDFAADFLFEKAFDFGLKGGMKVTFTKNLFTSLRYYFGVSSIMDKEIRDESNISLGKYQMYNRSIELSLGYLIKKN